MVVGDNAPAGFVFAPAGAFVVSASETGAITGDMAAPNPSASMSMNKLIASSIRSRRTVGLIDKLKTTPPLENDRAERFHQALADVERAAKAGDELARELAEARIDAVIEESRAARRAENEMSNVGRSAAEAAPAVPSFDGGVRRPAPRSREPLTMGQAIRAELASREEIRQRHQDHARAWDRAARR